MDDHTIRASYGDVTFIPVPGGLTKPIPSLISFRLPDGVTAGDMHRAVLQQIAGRSWLIMGGIEVRIPVRHSPVFLAAEERKLGVLRAIQAGMEGNDRWWPVFERYVVGIAGRIDGLGGNSGEISPQRDFPRVRDSPGGNKDDGICGKVAELHYDCHGDFEGFVLETCTGRHVFRACARGIETLLHRACASEATISVQTRKDAPKKPLRIVWRCC
ncbi:hypothetical protein [Cribrihabitans marinus]|uniref:hypothetical protein n=1 Tax=Cribrihabitans marinus TaxID=1227549 RepID=UPI0015A73185|nr:hypothetical protein [Cribrihabitans marinus]